MENTKIGAYATSHLKSDNKGEPRKNTPFSLLCLFFATIDSWKGRCCTSQDSVMFQYQWYMVRMVRKHQISADESCIEMAWLKKAAHLRVGNTKIGAYATSHLKSDNKGEPRKNTPFQSSLFIFCNYWFLKGKVFTSQVSVMFQYSVVHGKNG